MANRLSTSTSPYLRQHADNPVDWHEWGEEAFAEARNRDVPVLLSVGYATCHWCHVMAHESFEDEGTAAYMNEHFVNIKVDREERPDVDRIYMDAVQAVSGRGGWPMTVFLTPTGEPMYAGTYYPKARMGHHPSFMDVMEAIVHAWLTDRAAVVNQAIQIADAIAQPHPSGTSLPGIAELDAAVSRLHTVFDPVNGGFGGAPKFPQAPTLEFLLRTAALAPATRAGRESAAMLRTTLTAMAAGGIYDHVLGGFARYSVDAEWVIPHFEKMLYDNALLARTYLRAAQVLDEPAFERVAIEVLDYLDDTLADEGGAIHSGEDADSEGVEGKFAVWTWDELGDVLGDLRSLAAAIYGATEVGNFEGANNLHRFNDLKSVATAAGLDSEEVLVRKDEIDRRLAAAREERTPPSRDDKIVAAWNGLAIRAFAEAGRVLREPRYLDRARQIARFLLNDASPGGALVRSWRDRPGHPAFADDHAAVAIGLYALFQATGESEWYTAAEHHVDELRSRFASDAGGFHATPNDGEALIARPFNTQDNPTPSDNSLAMEALQIHAALTLDTAAIEELSSTMQRLADQALAHPGFGGYALAIWRTHLADVKEVAIVADTGDLTAAVWEDFKPDVVMAVSDGGETPVPLLAGRPAIEGLPTAYVCENFVCSLPVHSSADLLALLDGVE